MPSRRHTWTLGPAPALGREAGELRSLAAYSADARTAIEASLLQRTVALLGHLVESIHEAERRALRNTVVPSAKW